MDLKWTSLYRNTQSVYISRCNWCHAILWLVYSLEWITSSAEIQEKEREKKGKSKTLQYFLSEIFSSLVLILFAIQLLWTCFISAIRFRIRTNQDTSKEITVIFRVHVLIREWVLFLTLRVGLVPCPPPMGPTPYPQVPVADFLPVSQPELKVANNFKYFFFWWDNYQTVLISHFWKVKNRFFI